MFFNDIIYSMTHDSHLFATENQSVERKQNHMIVLIGHLFLLPQIMGPMVLFCQKQA